MALVRRTILSATSRLLKQKSPMKPHSLDDSPASTGERIQNEGAQTMSRREMNAALLAGQNVYLYCASEGLATVFRGAVDQEKLGRAMRLVDGQFVTFAQTVGYPAAS